MRQLGPIELARKELELRIRAEASIVRMKWLNEVLPTYLAEFDRRLNSGQPLQLEPPSAEDLIAEALKGAQ